MLRAEFLALKEEMEEAAREKHTKLLAELDERASEEDGRRCCEFEDAGAKEALILSLHLLDLLFRFM
jgi:hypothetical protein